ncbi:MAG TPA: hypothetical protein VHB48_07490 [Chitinophagaceae bacterium]|nr:hypothetical protein [Chitinophagaceae bacterium]
MKLLAYIAAFFILLPLPSTAQQKQQIIISSRTFHPGNNGDSINTIKAVKDFAAERVDWLYTSVPAYTKQLQDLNVPFSLALNPQVADSSGYTTAKGRIIDLHGNLFIAPWMKGQRMKNPYWGCVNAPYFKQLFLKTAKKLVDLGPYGILVDDPLFNIQAVKEDGCFCDYCVKGFTEYLRQNGVAVPGDFNYRQAMLADYEGAKKKYGKLWQQFQTQSVINFLTQWKAEVKEYAKRDLVFICNNYKGQWSGVYKVFDAGISEIEEKDIDFALISHSLDSARQLGKKQSFNFESDNENLLYGAILYTYINGSEALLPWDLWLQGKPKRFYGKKQNYEDLISLLKNVILNPAFTKTISKTKLKRYSLPANSYICYSYTNGTDTYDIIFNFKYRAAAPLLVNTGTRLSSMLKKPANNAFGRHYQNFSGGLVNGSVNSCFMVIKE